MCGTANELYRDACRQCGSKGSVFRPRRSRWDLLVDRLRQPLERWLRARPGVLGTQVAAGDYSVWFVGLCLVGVVVVGVGIVRSLWMERVSSVEGKVLAMEWQRTVYRETFTPVTKREWRDRLTLQPARMPVNGSGEVAGVADIRDCERRQSGTRQVKDGFTKKCETRVRSVECGTREVCSHEQLGNGFVKERCRSETKYCSKTDQVCRDVPRYRAEPVYGDLCAYDTWAWRLAEKRETRGGEEPARWEEAQFALGPLDRLRREERYTVNIGYETGGRTASYVLHPKAEAQFRSFRKGQSVMLDVKNNGQVQGLTGASPSPAR